MTTFLLQTKGRLKAQKVQTGKGANALFVTRHFVAYFFPQLGNKNRNVQICIGEK